jgi:aminoglycoside phosphotransferase (APT) family kinase protein
LLHGDCHAGNIFRAPAGFGLIDWQIVQRGGWALDVAYHLSAVLDVRLAEREERTLLNHYLDIARSLGNSVPSREHAWEQYRKSMVYGYYLWAITRRVEPAITNVFVNRLGSAIERHDSYSLLGL